MLVLALVRLLVIPAAAEPLPENLTDALGGEAEELLDELDAGEYDSLTLSEGLAQLGQRVGELFLSLFRDNISGAVMLLIVVVLCGLTGELHTAGAPDGSPQFVPMAGALVITLIALGPVRSLIGVGIDAM